jgi:hypothetical protein
MYNWDKIYNETKSLLGDNCPDFDCYLRKNTDINKVESFKSEMFAASLLKELSKNNSINLSFLEQSGSNHPDIKLKINGKLTHVEITRINSSDNRFKSGFTDDTGFNTNIHAHQIELDYTKTLITSKLTEKSQQYSKWIKKGIVHKDDDKIIGIDLGEIFPATPAAPLLFSAYHMFKDGLESRIDKPTFLPIPRGSVLKINKAGDEVSIYQDVILDSVKNSHINGIFAFTRFGLPGHVQIISINGNQLMDELYKFYFFRSEIYNLIVKISRHSFLY